MAPRRCLTSPTGSGSLAATVTKPVLPGIAILPALALTALTALPSRADLVITEVMPLSAHVTGAVNGDWWELTNTGASAVDLTGYQWDDTPEPDNPTVSYFPGVVINAGESIIILQEELLNVASWRAAWGLTAATRVLDRDQFAAMGGEAFSGLSGPNGDEINLYDQNGELVAHVSFGASIEGRSQAFLRDGTPIYGLHSVAGRHGARNSTQSPPDVASPGDATIHFTSVPPVYGQSDYSYAITAVDPAGSAPTISAAGLPAFLTLTPGPDGTATLSNSRPLGLAEAGNHIIQLTATGSMSSTLQVYILTVLSPSPAVILNEYNAVAATNFLNGGTALYDNDGGELSADAHFGRVIGNGGQWVEFVVTGDGGPGLVDLRNWSVEIGTNGGSGFTVTNTLALSSHPDWQAVPSGTILTFIDRNTAQGGLDSGFAIRDRRTTTGDTWTNIWIGDPDHIAYTSYAVNGYSVLSGTVYGIVIDNSNTQFRVRNAAGEVVFGPAGEGVAPASGVSSEEILELEAHPSPAISPIVASTETTQGYDDGASDSTFGHPNTWLHEATTTAQEFTPYAADAFQQWVESCSLTGPDALREADPDGDGRDNLAEYAFGGIPTVADAAYPAGAPSPGPVVAWSYVRRADDPTLVFTHESSTDLSLWTPLTPASNSSVPSPDHPGFAIVTLQFDRPVPQPQRWFLRARAQ